MRKKIFNKIDGQIYDVFFLYMTVLMVAKV